LRDQLLRRTDRGLYCQQGDFFVDPWAPVERAVVTHGHSDHARTGSASYLAARDSGLILRHRLGATAGVETLEYGEVRTLNGVKVSLHPAGHILGSAQVRVEHRGEVWVVSGDYKTDPDPSCAPFELVPCDTFITEATFGLPIYRWPDPESVCTEINAWWRQNQGAGRASMLYAYALGKAQRILAGLDLSIGPIFVHGAVAVVNRLYATAGVDLPAAKYVGDAPRGTEWSRALIVAPTSARDTPWLRRFGRFSDGFASGWMRVRGQRRRRSIDRGFVLSDHVDWPNLIRVISETGASRVLVTHGYGAVVARYLQEQGYDAHELETRYRGDEEGGEEDDAPSIADAPLH
jgi:putative mRNA 3-end processing factor